MGAPSAAPTSDDREDVAFRHYTLKHRIISWVSINLFDHMTYTVRHGLLKGMKRKGGLGWAPEGLMPGTPTAEHRFWSELPLAGMTVYDVGAFHGLLTLLFAARAKEVVAFEPNTANHKRLLENLALNQATNVQVRKSGVGSKRETRTLVVNPLMQGGGSVDDRTVAGLLESDANVAREDIHLVSLDEEIVEAGLPAPDFIKIDVEGWEIEVLRGAAETLARHRPTLFLEMHGETMREKKQKVADIVGFLWEHGYHDIEHIETGSAITPENTTVAVEGHLYCRPTSA